LLLALLVLGSVRGTWLRLTRLRRLRVCGDHPFATASPLPFHAPAFDKIRVEYFLPTFTFGMKQQLSVIIAIASQTEALTFKNTIEAMERSGALLTRVDNVFSNLTSAETNEPLQNIETELAPLKAAHSDNIL
jgi:peptidyl-dipeptidase Dcp